MKTPDFVRIATRKSPLAIIQAELVKGKLLATFPGLSVEIVPMQTTGDQNPGISLADIGGKGLFTKELEEGLLSGKIDIAVHSLKDMETVLPKNLIVGAVLEREDPRDVLVAPKAKTLQKLPKGASLGTSSVRRAALVKILRPDLVIKPLRGNIATRLAKVTSGELDAAILAMAGLKRLGMETLATEIFDADSFIPAVGQGIIAVECKEDNSVMRDMLQKINHAPTYIAATAERSMLAALDGSCRTPIGGFAKIDGDKLHIDAIVASNDGTKHVKATKTGALKNAVTIGKEIAMELLANGGKECLAQS